VVAPPINAGLAAADVTVAGPPPVKTVSFDTDGAAAAPEPAAGTAATVVGVDSSASGIAHAFARTFTVADPLLIECDPAPPVTFRCPAHTPVLDAEA
jgi:hypothetical protein